MKTFLEFISESIVDKLQPTLSPQIFDNPASSEPRLKTVVQDQIKRDLASISTEVEILDVVLVGSILTKRYRYDTDLDIHILAKGKSDDEMSVLAKKFSERRVSGTLHPINYYIISNKADHDRSNSLADGEFDPIKNQYRRKPSDDLPFDLTKYFSAFQEKVRNINHLTADLKHELIDYNQLKSAPKEDLKRLQKLIEQHLKNIESDAKELITIYNEIRKGRKDAFEADVTADEIRQYGSKNRTPGNVLFKLMEKYHYLQFLKKIKEIVGEDLKVSDAEAKKLSKLIVKESDDHKAYVKSLQLKPGDHDLSDHELKDLAKRSHGIASSPSQLSAHADIDAMSPNRLKQVISHPKVHVFAKHRARMRLSGKWK